MGNSERIVNDMSTLIKEVHQFCNKYGLAVRRTSTPSSTGAYDYIVEICYGPNRYIPVLIHSGKTYTSWPWVFGSTTTWVQSVLSQLECRQDTYAQILCVLLTKEYGLD